MAKRKTSKKKPTTKGTKKSSTKGKKKVTKKKTTTKKAAKAVSKKETIKRLTSSESLRNFLNVDTANEHEVDKYCVETGYHPLDITQGWAEGFRTEQISVKEMADKIVQLTQSKSRFVFKSLPVDDPKVRQPDISLAKKMLHWEPKIDLEEGLKRSLNYFKRRILV